MNKFNELIEKFGVKKDFFFIQVGAHDGVHQDPIHDFILKYDWSGILIEPVPDYFELLVENYENKEGLIFEQVAVSSSVGNADIWYWPKQNTGPWLKNKLDSDDYGCASLSRELFDIYPKSKRKNSRLMSTNVSVTTLRELTIKHKVQHIDLLQIDAEGFDFEVIKGIDWNGSYPGVINFESNKLDMEEVTRFLKERGYSLNESDVNRWDTLAIHKDLQI
jgi:FkbM family methyltransferase